MKECIAKLFLLVFGNRSVDVMTNTVIRVTGNRVVVIQELTIY